MDTLHLLHDSDLRKLLATAPAELPGRILCLNRSLRYHNQLDAIAISVDLLQLRSGVNKRYRSMTFPIEFRPLSASSGSLPDSSALRLLPDGRTVFLFPDEQSFLK